MEIMHKAHIQKMQKSDVELIKN